MFRYIRSYLLLLTILVTGLILGCAFAEGSPLWAYRLDAEGFAHITSYTDTAADRTSIPAQLDGHDVIGVDAGAFSSCIQLKEIQLPGSVSMLEDGAFSGPENLCLAGYNGSAALNYAKQHDLNIRNLSRIQFLPGVKDLSDMEKSHFSVSGSTVRINALNARRIQKGDIFYLPVNNGTAYKAVTIEQEDGWVSIRTATPALDLVAEKLSIHETVFYPDYDNIVILSKDAELLSTGSRNSTSFSGSFKYQLNPAVSYTISLNTSVEEVDFDGKLVPFEVNNFVCILNNSYSVKIKASGNAQLLDDIYTNKYKQWIDLARIPFASASGLVNMNLVFRIRLTLDAGLELTCSVEDAKDGLSYSRDVGWMRHNQKGKTSIDFEGRAKLEYTTGFAATLSVPLIKDLIAVQLNFPIGVEGKYGFDSNNPETISCFDLDSKFEAYVSASIGVENEFFDKQLGVDLKLEYESPRLSLLENNLHFEDGVIVPKCTRKSYLIKLVTGNGEELPDIRMVGDDWPNLPTLARENYSFEGWYTAAGCTDDVRVSYSDFSNRDTDITLYAGWKYIKDPEEEEIEHPTNIKETDARHYSYNGPWTSEINSTIVVNGKVYNLRPFSAARGIPDNTPLRQIRDYIVEDGHMSWEQQWKDTPIPADTLLWAYNLHSSERITRMSYSSDIVGTEGNPRCINLSSVSFHNGMVDVGTYIYCSKLTNITLPRALRYIRSEAFYGCSGLTEISIPENCTSIGTKAFAHSGLQSISVPDSVESIAGAFTDAYELTRASVSGSVKANAGAFKNCFSLSNISLKNGMETIGTSMFENCLKLASVSVPASVKQIQAKAFYNSGVTSVGIQGEAVAIGSEAFGRTPLTSFSANVSSIDNSAFASTPNLRSVTLTGSNIDIEFGAFADSGVRSLTINADGALYLDVSYIPLLEDLNVHADEIYIDGAESLCLKEMSLSGDVVRINDFSWCEALKSVKVNARQITGSLDFSSCTSLETLELTGSLDSLPMLFGTKVKSFSGSLERYSTNVSNLNGATALNTLSIGGNLGTVTGSLQECFSLQEADLRNSTMNSCDVSNFGPINVYLPDNVPKVINKGNALIYCKNNSVTAAACDAAGIPHAEPGQQWCMLTIVYGIGQIDGSMSFGAGNVPLILPEPEDYDYTFMGWYLDEEFTMPYEDLTAMPGYDMSVYAKWDLNFFNPDNGGWDNSDMQSYGEFGWGLYLSSYSLPRTILPVKQDFLMANCFKTNTLREIILEDTVKYIGKNAFAAEPYLEKITVEEGNKQFYDVDGVLYSRAGSLVACPPQWASSVLHVPEGITTIAAGAFGNGSSVSTVQELHLPQSITVIEEGALTGLTEGTLVYGPDQPELAAAAEAAGLLYNNYPIGYVADGKLISILYARQGELLPAVGSPRIPGRIFHGWSLTEDGALIDPDNFEMPAEKLLLYAVCYGSGLVSTIPNAVTEIEAESFAGNALETFYCSEWITSIGNRAFADCSRLMIIDLSENVTFIAANAFEGSAQVTFIAPAGSYAEEYANTHGIPCRNP